MGTIMCKIITPYKCNKCGNDTLFFYTKNNTLIDYKRFFKECKTLKEIKETLESRNIKYIKCINCNTLHIIDWTTGYPTQLMSKNTLEQFGVI